jgi:hypothetical protein
MGPAIGCRPADTCCRWCLVVKKVVVATARVDGNTGSATEAGATKVLTTEALATKAPAPVDEVRL